ncbi:MAG TPA: hypothetical protein VH120_16755, partial [Gemmataceae bacterium]|nr:hypothetical protein [Gemmataceae bacterium]
STLGFLQYLAPSVQFVLAVTVLHESMDAERWRSFGLIWTALAIYSFDAWRTVRRDGRRNSISVRPQPPIPPSPVVPPVSSLHR